MFHIMLPTSMVFFLILLSAVQPAEGVLAAHQATLAFSADEAELKKRLDGSVFQSDGMRGFPGLLDARSLIADIRQQLSPIHLEDSLFHTDNSAGIHNALVHLQSYWASRVRMNAEMFGWCRRDRMYWGRVNGLKLDKVDTSLPDNFKAIFFDSKRHFPHVVYLDPKPVPPSVSFDDSGTLTFSPSEVVRETAAFNQGEISYDNRRHRGMQTFSAEYYHPWEESYNRFSPDQIARYKADNCRFAPRAYGDGDLIWNDRHCRQPNSRERLSMMGFPPQTLEAVPPRGRSRADLEAARNSMVGNGFHLPSLMVTLAREPISMSSSDHTCSSFLRRPARAVELAEGSRACQISGIV